MEQELPTLPEHLKVHPICLCGSCCSVLFKGSSHVFVTEYDCPEDKGKCRDEIQCISLDNFCDGYAHCKDKSDEDPEFCRGM